MCLLYLSQDCSRSELLANSGGRELSLMLKARLRTFIYHDDKELDIT